MSENLSTFSAHITNVLDILSRANEDSLVLMDELGSGTDPTEGMGIAVAVLEELRKSGALYMVTTHYPEIKTYANETPGVVNARMLFDRESLRPLYQMEMGAAGDSCAFYIAKKLGMPDEMLAAAERVAYGNPQPSGQKPTHGSVVTGTNGGFAGKDTAASRPAKLKKTSSPSIKKKPEALAAREKLPQYSIGDSVMVYPEKKVGIVYKPVNDKGDLCVQLQGKKIWMNYKRVRLHVAAAELYPPDYDFSIIFETVRERKIHHDMRRKYVEDVLETEDN